MDILEQAQERKRRLLATCNHFTGVLVETCLGGERPTDHQGTVGHSFACVKNEAWTAGGCPQCPKFKATSEEEVSELRHRMLKSYASAVFDHKKSPCCNATIDESQVIAEGRFKGHGARTCSTCGKVVFRA